MTDGLIESATQSAQSTDPRVYGVTVAQVISNMDLTGQGRVQVRLPWLPGVEPWARVAVLMAGSDRGTYFIPQVDDEVLVAFNHGDVREPYIVGSLWNGQDRPPATAPTDAANRCVIRTPQGHEIEFDDLTQSITIKSSSQQQIEIGPREIEVSTPRGTALLRLHNSGNITLESRLNIEMKAQKISIQGQVVEIKSSASTSINAGPSCDIQGNMVRIN